MNWAYYFRDQHDICLATHNHAVSMSNVKSVCVNLNDNAAMLCLLDEFRPDVIVHAAGLTNVDECERCPELAIEVNAELAGNMAKLANQQGVKFIHLSTDQMFKGDRSFATELDDLQPINNYGLSKCKAEALVLRYAPEALIIRTNFYGWGHENRQSITDWIIGELRKGNAVKAFSDVFFTPMLVDDLVRVIYKLLEHSAVGIFNVVGNERISKYDFALIVADVFDLEKGCIIKADLSDVKLLARRPFDMSLSNAKVTSFLGEGMASVLDGVKSLLHTHDRKKYLNKSLMVD